MEFLKKNEFIKMQGTGNNFIIIQKNSQTENQLSQLTRKLCDSNFGIGADGILVIAREEKESSYQMKIFNRDGSKAEMCGNGLRCFGACLRELGAEKQEQFKVITDAGVKKVKALRNINGSYQVQIEMGPYCCKNELVDFQQQICEGLPNLHFNFAQYLVFNVPHLIICLNEMPAELKIIEYGKKLQQSINANINFITIRGIQQDRTHIEIMTYERGAGLTLACGTGSCAAAIVCLLRGLVRGQAVLENKGGCLTIFLNQDRVMMSGSAQFICRGVYYEKSNSN